MLSSLQTYLTLLLAGLFMIGLETIIPGGILGILGGCALLAAAVSGFYAFPAPWGFVSALGIVALSGLTVALWVKYFPRTFAGRILTLSQDTRSFKAATPLLELAGKEGVARTRLRPAGIAQIEGKRVDVVADGSWIESGTRIRVVDVEGNRVTVREITGS